MTLNKPNYQDFLWGTLSATSATGASGILHTPGSVKAVQASLGSAGGTATVAVYGSLTDGVISSASPYGTLLTTLSLSGAYNVASWAAQNAYSALWVNVTGITSATVSACVRSQNA
jgi:hypothetical protein